MEIDDANELIIGEALRRLGRETRLDSVALQERIAEVVREQGKAIFGQLSEESREQLRQEGIRIKERAAHLERINEAIEYGRLLIAKYGVKTLGELPEDEQLEFARIWTNATGGRKTHEN